MVIAAEQNIMNRKFIPRAITVNLPVLTLNHVYEINTIDSLSKVHLVVVMDL